MHAVILAGGKGTRLKPFTTTLPKPLVPVGEDPILAIVLAQLKRAGFTRVTLAIRHMAELIISFFGAGERYGLAIDYSVERTPLGTVGPLTLIPDLAESFLVMNGDILTDLDFASFFAAHLEGEQELTVASCLRESLVDFGVLHIDNASSLVTGFTEKPRSCIQVSMGIYAFRRSLLNRVPKGTPYGFDQLMHEMLRRQVPVQAYPFSGYWLDLGRPDDYDRANLDIERVESLKRCACVGTSR